MLALMAVEGERRSGRTKEVFAWEKFQCDLAAKVWRSGAIFLTVQIAWNQSRTRRDCH